MACSAGWLTCSVANLQMVLAFAGVCSTGRNEMLYTEGRDVPFVRSEKPCSVYRMCRLEDISRVCPALCQCTGGFSEGDCKCLCLKQHLPLALKPPSPRQNSRSRPLSLAAWLVFSEVTRTQSHTALPLVAPHIQKAPLVEYSWLLLLPLPLERSCF